MKYKNKRKKIPLIFLVFFLVGALIGVGASYVVTKDDCFILNGSKEIILDVNDTYVDQGVKVVAFGKDISDDVIITIYDCEEEEVEEIDTTIENEYTIIYTINSKKWNDYKLIRRVIVGGENNE